MSIFYRDYKLNYKYKNKIDVDYDNIEAIENKKISLTQEFEIILDELKDDNLNLVQRQDQINMLSSINFELLKLETLLKNIRPKKEYNIRGI